MDGLTEPLHLLLQRLVLVVYLEEGKEGMEGMMRAGGIVVYLGREMKGLEGKKYLLCI